MQEQHQGRRLAGQVDFSIVEAAAVTGRSRITIRRYLDAQRFPNAYRDVQSSRRPSPWRIPASDLRATGLTITEPVMQDDAASPGAETVEERIVRLETEVAVRRAEAAERQRTIELLTELNGRLIATVVDLAARH